MRFQSVLIRALLFAILSPTCSLWANERETDLIRAEAVPDETSLLDVGILPFDPGLPDDAKRLYKLEAQGIFTEVRRSEAIYIPVHLERTLQTAGFWGVVRLVPTASIVDVTISGTIVASDGEELEVEIRAVDSRGKVWLDKRYKGKANASVYLREERTDEPFQALYNQIANDLLSKRKKLSPKEDKRIQTISGLRFAADLAPAVFSGYLDTGKKTRYSLSRLPAHDDPMMARVTRLRQRDRMFIDLLDSHYRDFYDQMQEAYTGWRSQNYWEYQTLKNDFAGIGDEWSSGSPRGGSAGIIPRNGIPPWEGAGPMCGTPGAIGAIDAGKRAEQAQRKKEAKKKSHLEELRELGASLASDLAPRLVEVEGKVTELTGSADAQYRSWRELLRKIFAAETGLPTISRAPTLQR